MGGHRDELSFRERSLDVLIGLLKEEMVSNMKTCVCMCVCMCVSVRVCMYSDIVIHIDS